MGPAVPAGGTAPLFLYRIETRNFGGRTVLGLELGIAGLGVLLAARWMTVAPRRRRTGTFLGMVGVLVGIFVAGGSIIVPLAPSEYLHNPSPGDAASVARGRPLYAQHCAVCHGLAGRGDGPQAKVLGPPPADLAGGYITVHSDEELFYWVTNGIGGTAMPGFKDRLNETQRWDIVNYVRSLALAME